MNLLQAILSTVATRNAEGSTFKVSSIWATERVIVLESVEHPIEAKKKGIALCASLKFAFPDLIVELYPPDADGTTITMTY